MLPDGIQDAVDKIARATGETVAVAAPAGTNAVFLYVMESDAPVRFSASMGYQVPIHTTSTGRALLSQFTPRERSILLKKVKFNRYARHSVMSVEQVESEIKRATARGWHESIDGHSQDLTGVAISIGFNGRRLAVVVGGPTSRMQPQIKKIAATLARVLTPFQPGQSKSDPE